MDLNWVDLTYELALFGKQQGADVSERKIILEKYSKQTLTTSHPSLLTYNNRAVVNSRFHSIILFMQIQQQLSVWSCTFCFLRIFLKWRELFCWFQAQWEKLKILYWKSLFLQFFYRQSIENDIFFHLIIFKMMLAKNSHLV
jgi:hypothetical protein